MTDEDKIAALRERVDRHEREIRERLDRHDRRLHEVETSHAVAETNRTHMDARFDKLEAKLAKVFSIVVGGIGLAIIGALMNFILQGGLNVQP